MKIYRHSYVETEVTKYGYPSVLCQDLNSFGFCTREGEPFEVDIYKQNSGQDINIRWTYDTKDVGYLHTFWYFYAEAWDSNLKNWYYHASNGDNLYFYYNSSWGLGRSVPIAGIFLPLKNNGFYLHLRQSDQESWTALPTLQFPSMSTDSWTQQYSLNWIGLPPTSTKDSWTYILFNPIYDPNEELADSSFMEIDYNNNICTTAPYLSNSTSKYNITQYMNFNSHICSLIRIPYDVEYLNGIYLLATSPFQITNNAIPTFFSFGGRNFLRVFSNYVFELPSS